MFDTARLESHTWDGFLHARAVSYLLRARNTIATRYAEIIFQNGYTKIILKKGRFNERRKKIVNDQAKNDVDRKLVKKLLDSQLLCIRY